MKLTIGAAALAIQGEVTFTPEVLSDLIPAFSVGAALLLAVLLLGASRVRLQLPSDTSR